MHSKATDRRSASKCEGKWPDQTRDQAFGLPEVLVAVSTSRLSCKRAGKTRTLMPVWDSSGESRLTRAREPPIIYFGVHAWLCAHAGDQDHRCIAMAVSTHLAGSVHDLLDLALGEIAALDCEVFSACCAAIGYLICHEKSLSFLHSVYIAAR